MARTFTSPGPERTNRLIFIGAVGLALLAAVLVFASLANFGGDDANAGSLGDSLDVVVASQDISPGQLIGADMVELSSLPVNAIVDEAFTDEALVVGTRAQVRVTSGDQLAPSKVTGAGAEDANGLGYIVPPGMRAASVSVSEETSVGGLVLPGDRVDVIVVVDSSIEGQDFRRGVLLLQDIEVLAVAQKTLRPVSRVDENGDPITSESADGGVAARDENVDEDPDAASVTLALPPEDAPLIALAQSEGTVYLSLRGVGDDSFTDDTVRELPQ